MSNYRNNSQFLPKMRQITTREWRKEGMESEDEAIEERCEEYDPAYEVDDDSTTEEDDEEFIEAL